MTYREKVVYEAVERVIARRAAAHRFPECALQSEIRDEIGVPVEDLPDVLASLVSSGYLTVHPAQNEQSYYLTDKKP